jgi:hypothetical protein
MPSQHRYPQTNLRLSDEARDLLARITQHYLGSGGSQTQAVEIVLREHARALGIFGRPPA